MDKTSSITLLNSTLKATPQQRTFHLFPSLPKELRLQIWEEAVPRERLIRVYLRHLGEREDEPPPRYVEKNHLGKPISGPRYKATAEGHKINSKFLRVNKEAREVALAFHRVHLPFSLRHPRTNRAEETTLYLNPEHDILQIDADAPVRETLIDFFWDMKAYDPRGIGLVKMAIDLEGFCAHDLQYLKRSDLLLIRQRNILVETLSQLNEVWFVYVESGRSGSALTTGQMICNTPSGPCASNGHGKLHADGRLTTSPGMVPIAGSISTFDRVGSDPRKEANTELSQLSMGRIDAREIVWRWRRLLRSWDIRHQPDQVKYRLLVGQRPVSRDGTWCIGTADQVRDFISVKNTECGVGDLPVAVEFVGEETRREKTVAVGHWLFPIEALGSISGGDSLLDMDFRPCQLLDMRNYWPELLLSSIG